MTPSLSALAALRERLEKATGADREIDADIRLLWQEPNEHYQKPWRRPILLEPEHQRPGILEYVEISGVSVRAAAAYTSSLDAALALVERSLPERGWFVGLNEAGQYVAAVDGPLQRSVGTPYDMPEYYREPINAEAPTPALALCLALVRAKLANTEGA